MCDVQVLLESDLLNMQLVQNKAARLVLRCPDVAEMLNTISWPLFNVLMVKRADTKI